MGSRGPDPQFDEDFLLKWTNEMRLHMEKIKEEEGHDSVSEAVRSILRKYIEHKERDPSANPDQMRID